MKNTVEKLGALTTLACLLLGAAEARPVITTGGAAVYEGAMPAGLDLRVGVTEAYKISIWDEQQNVTLVNPLEVNILPPTSYPETYVDNGPLNPGTIPSGTVVNSYFVHYDRPPGSFPYVLEGSVTTDRPILGLIVKTNKLVNSDSVLGISSTTYDVGNARGMDNNGNDWLVWESENTVRVHLRVPGYIDEIRIVVDATVEVDIDIKPGSFPNSINPNAGGVIPVAILTTDTFDASAVDPQTVALEGAGARGKGKSGNYGSMEDVDGDGDLDLVVQVVNEITWAENATEATLTGETWEGVPIEGTDSVRIVPPEP